MIVIVLAAASRNGGALSIFRQFLDHLPAHKADDKYYIFKDGNVTTPKIDGVEYVVDNNHSVLHRIYFDAFGLKRWCKNHGIVPDIVISFQNSASRLGCRQLIYYHQSLPFYPEKWNPFKSSERSLFFYTKIYPILVKATLTRETEVVVQTQVLRDLFAKCYDFNYDRTYAMFPDLELIESKEIKEIPLIPGTYNFIYPAIAAKYKQQATIVNALEILKKQNFENWSNIRIYLTFEAKDYPELYQSIVDKGLCNQFVFTGRVPHSKLLSCYKSMHGLLFPSTIETIGLPMLEAAAFGLPIIATNREFAQEVLKGYKGVVHVDSFDAHQWSDSIKNLCGKRQRYAPLTQKGSSWPEFFKLIKKKVKE